MTDVIEVDANTSNNNNKPRLPNVKRWLLPEYEELRCNMLEVVLSAGVAHQYTKLKDEATNPWRKAYNGLWDKDVGVLRSHEEPKGEKQSHYVKNKIMNDYLPSFEKKYDGDINNNINPLPSFVMAKNMKEAHDKMLKDHEDMKKAKEEKRKELLNDMKKAEASVGIGLENIHTPQKTSLHSTNLSSGENASTTSALLSSGDHSNKNNSANNDKGNPFSPIQDQMKSMNEFFSSATSKLTSDFNNEIDIASSSGNVDNHNIKKLKLKLKAMKESHAFAKETGNVERAKKKMKAIEELEDKIEDYYDKLD